MKQLRVFLVVFVLILISAGTSQAGVLFNNFEEPGDTYNTIIGFSVGIGFGGVFLEQAMSFTPSATADLSSIDLVISLNPLGGGTNRVALSLVNDDQGFPLGSTLESWTFTNQMGTLGTTAPILTADSVLNPLLQAGTAYWLVASAPVSDTDAAWNYNSSGGTGPTSFSMDGGLTWSAPRDATQGVFRVNGVPEPSTLLLLGAGLAGVGLLRRRFKK